MHHGVAAIVRLVEDALNASGRWFAAATRGWEANRLRRRTRSALGLQDGEVYDLRFLTARRFVCVQVVWWSPTRVRVRIESRIERPLRVLVRPGSHLDTRRPRRDLVVCREVIAEVPPAGTLEVGVDVSYVDAARETRDGDSPVIQVRQADEMLARFLERAGDVHVLAIQAGVWALASDLSAEKIRRLLMASDPQRVGVGARADEHIAVARTILDALQRPHALR